MSSPGPEYAHSVRKLKSGCGCGWQQEGCERKGRDTCAWACAWVSVVVRGRAWACVLGRARDWKSEHHISAVCLFSHILLFLSVCASEGRSLQLLVQQVRPAVGPEQRLCSSQGLRTDAEGVLLGPHTEVSLSCCPSVSHTHVTHTQTHTQHTHTHTHHVLFSLSLSLSLLLWLSPRWPSVRQHTGFPTVRGTATVPD